MFYISIIPSCQFYMYYFTTPRGYNFSFLVISMRPLITFSCNYFSRVGYVAGESNHFKKSRRIHRFPVIIM